MGISNIWEEILLRETEHGEFGNRNEERIVDTDIEVLPIPFRDSVREHRVDESTQHIERLPSFILQAASLNKLDNDTAKRWVLSSSISGRNVWTGFGLERKYCSKRS